eukprot:Clim_evm12s149 gene=Clim_evmTU12s149
MIGTSAGTDKKKEEYAKMGAAPLDQEFNALFSNDHLEPFRADDLVEEVKVSGTDESKVANEAGETDGSNFVGVSAVFGEPTFAFGDAGGSVRFQSAAKKDVAFDLSNTPGDGQRRLFAEYVWTGAVALAEQVLGTESKVGTGYESPLDLRNRSVVELGAGAGLPSLAAAHSGAAVVVTTDYPDKLIQDNLRQNFIRNGLYAHDNSYHKPQQQVGGQQNGGVKKEEQSSSSSINVVTGLDWSQPSDAFHALTVLTAVRSSAEFKDHHQAQQTARVRRGPIKFDVCLMADCFWEPRHHDILLQTCRRLIGSTGVGIVSYANRMRNHTHRDFFRKARDEYGAELRLIAAFKLQTVLGVESEDDEDERDYGFGVLRVVELRFPEKD